MKKTVLAVSIDGGIVSTSFFGRTESAKSFFKLTGTAPAKKVSVKGWNFKTIYITHGNEENGSGWAFA